MCAAAAQQQLCQQPEAPSGGIVTTENECVAPDTDCVLGDIIDQQPSGLTGMDAVNDTAAPVETLSPKVFQAMGLAAAHRAGMRRIRRGVKRMPIRHTAAANSVGSEQKSAEHAVQPTQVVLRSHVSQLINDRIDKPFTIDVREANNSAVNATECWSPERCLKSDVSGNMLWIDAQPDMLYVLLKHYMECKQKSPYTTGACVVVPAKPATWPTPWTELLKGMQHIASFDKRSHLYENVPTEIAQQAVVVYYDPPHHMQLNTANSAAAPVLTMNFSGTANMANAVIAMDSQASTSFVSKSWLQRASAQYKPTGSARLSKSANGRWPLHTNVRRSSPAFTHRAVERYSHLQCD